MSPPGHLPAPCGTAPPPYVLAAGAHRRPFLLNPGYPPGWALTRQAGGKPTHWAELQGVMLLGFSADQSRQQPWCLYAERWPL